VSCLSVCKADTLLLLKEESWLAFALQGKDLIWKKVGEGKSSVDIIFSFIT